MIYIPEQKRLARMKSVVPMKFSGRFSNKYTEWCQMIIGMFEVKSTLVHFTYASEAQILVSL